MPSDITRFTHSGMSWSDVADAGELNAVLYRRGSERVNLLMHSATLYGAKKALTFGNARKKGLVLDFGCGVARTVRFFGEKGWAVIGTEISSEMLYAARKFGLPNRSLLAVTDGVCIPLRDQSVDMVWVCGVLKYSLFEPGSPCRITSDAPKSDEPASAKDENQHDTEAFVPVYRDIAEEMYRILKPGGYVANLEMWVDAPPDVFITDFEQVGFITKQVSVLRRYRGYLERFFQWRDWHRLPPKSVLAAGRLSATLRYWLDNPWRAAPDFRDYLFIWSKPRT